MTSKESAITIDDSSDEEEDDTCTTDDTMVVDLTEPNDQPFTFTEEPDEGTESLETWLEHPERIPRENKHPCDLRCVGCVHYYKWFQDYQNVSIHRWCCCSECFACRGGNDDGTSRPCVRTYCVETIELPMIHQCIKQWKFLYTEQRHRKFYPEKSHCDCYYKRTSPSGQVEFTKAKVISLTENLMDDRPSSRQWRSHQPPPANYLYTIRLCDFDETIVRDVPKELLEHNLSKRMFRHLERLHERLRDLQARPDTAAPFSPSKPQGVHLSSHSSSFNTNIQLHDRVFAVFQYNGKFDEHFWGRVYRIRRHAGSNQYDVRFCDNDVRVNIPRTEIYHERDVDVSLNPKAEDSWSYEQPLQRWDDVLEIRCGSCKSCKRSGKPSRIPCNCRGCKQPPTVRGCIHSICELTISKHQFRLPDSFPHCWSFRLKKSSKGTTKEPFVIDAKGDEIPDKHIPKALMACGHTALQIQECCKQLREVECGRSSLSFRLPRFLGQRWLQECLDAEGKICLISGTIADCKPIIGSEHGYPEWTYYYLSLDDDCTGKPDWFNECPYLSETDTIRGIVAFKRRNNEKVGHRAAETWLVPKDFKREQSKHGPTISFTFDQCHFRLTRDTSNIPNAGYGLFVKISTEQPHRNAFKLPMGKLLDLGVYGPHTKDDFNNETTLTIKNFLYQHQPAVYSFQSKTAGLVIDPLDDATCEIKPVAQKSLLVYANETEESNVEPSVEIKHDAYGSVHYLMGRQLSSTEPLSIPIGERVELHVDYSERYEQNRVRFGYPRVTGVKLEQLQTEIDAFDDVFVEELETAYSLENLRSGLELVTMRKDSGAKNFAAFYQRALALLLAIKRRLKTSFASYQDDIDRSVHLIDWICAEIKGLSLDLKTKIVLGFPPLTNLVSAMAKVQPFDGNIEHLTTNQLSDIILERSLSAGRKRPLPLGSP